MIRVGQGGDIHALVAGRKLIIGGVLIPHERGLLGHSDADVLVLSLIHIFLHLQRPRRAVPNPSPGPFVPDF